MGWGRAFWAVGLVLMGGCSGSGPGGPSPPSVEPLPSGDGGVAPAPPARDPVSPEVVEGRDMVEVPAGPFAMGWNQGEQAEQPVHVVRLDDFLIDRFEVTVAQYRSCVDAGICQEPVYGPNCNWDNAEGGLHPINCVNWFAARDYCAWVGLRLPSEAEWEKAARGNEGRVYPWGSDLEGHEANYRIGAGTSTEPVGSHPSGVSPYGAHDMGGNVWEWVADWYGEDYYSRSPPRNPTGPELGTHRVLRGGSWWFEADALPAAHRVPYVPLLTDIDIGFRCVR